jgi:hypothetical protein
LVDVSCDSSTAGLLERIDRLERALAGGAVPAGPAPMPSTPSTAPTDDPAPVRGPAEEARRVLAEKGSPRPAAPSKPAPSPAAAKAAPPAAPAAAPPQPPAAEPPAAGDASGSPLPSREQLTLAWGDTVVGTLPGPAKARFLAGRFVDVEPGAAVFALPNEMHRARCEELRPAVEAALAAHFGRPVPLKLVVEVARPEPDPAAADEAEHVDLDDLVDAPATPVRSAAERLTDAFPGAQLLEGETR